MRAFATITLLITLLSTLLITVPAAAEAAAGRPVIHLGSRGPAVVSLQRNLHIPADGDFGRQTKRAVIAFQRRHHLSADGVVGARTWRALGGAPRARVPAHRSTKHTVRRPAVPSPVSAVRTRAVYLAAAQRGKPYRWGAAGPSSFDCSGLVQWVYRRLGVSVPRTTWTQYARLRHVSRAAMQPGDLVFLDGLGHVGIYAGFGQIWHAPHSGSRVKLSVIWDRHYVVARAA